jgi:hypothetical protein
MRSLSLTPHPLSLLPLPPLFSFSQADLAAVDRCATPWVVVSMHRPMYVVYPHKSNRDVGDHLRDYLEVRGRIRGSGRASFLMARFRVRSRPGPFERLSQGEGPDSRTREGSNGARSRRLRATGVGFWMCAHHFASPRPSSFTLAHTTPTRSLFSLINLQGLMLEFRVDVVISGHVHSYYRTCSVREEQCTDDYSGIVHIVVGE